MLKNGEVYYYQLDQLGTPLSLIDGENNIVWQASYSVFGKAAVTRNEIDNSLRFQGQYFDSETGLHYNHFRYYDPETGHFISQDPIGLLGGINHYQYAPNHINWIDPLGLVCKEAFKNINGVIYSGRIHRMEKPENTATTWQAGSWNVNASHRYSDEGIGAVYGGTTKKTALSEVLHYDVKSNYDSSQRIYKYKDISIDNILDLTDSNILVQLDICLEQIIKTGPGAEGSPRI